MGLLAGRDDVFWLRFDEILAGLRGEAPAPYHQRISERRAEHALWLALAAPPVLGVPPARLPERPPLADEVGPAAEPPAGVITGLGASAGLAQGRARLGLWPQELPRLQRGDILVAPM